MHELGIEIDNLIGDVGMGRSYQINYACQQVGAHSKMKIF
jgi:hypothetical protein